MNHSNKTILTLGLLAGSLTLSQAAVTYTLPASPTTPAGDGWTGDDLPNWVSSNFSGLDYLRNNNGGDNTITRAFETGIQATDTTVTLTIDARTNGNFSQYGLSGDGATLLFGFGINFNASGQYFVMLNGSRTNVGGSTSGDAVKTLSLELDSATGSAQLYVDGAATGSAITSSSGANLINELVGADTLYHRSNSQFVGAGSYTIEGTPEPSSVALLGLGGLALVLRRRK